MAFENYQVWSWVIYLLSALVVMLVTLRITRRWWRTLRGVVLTTVAVLFLMPWYVTDGAGTLAPAVIMVFFELLEGEGSGMRAGGPLLAGFTVSYLLLALFLWFSRGEGRRDSAASESDEN